MEIANEYQSPRRYDGRRSGQWVASKQTANRSVAKWILSVAMVSCQIFCREPCLAEGGVFVLSTEDETLRQPIASRMELFRPDGKPQVVRHVAGAGRGIVVSESVELTLPDGDYRFRFTRGPEYRIIQGTFSLERTSEDQRTVMLPRMVDMRSEGWISCDLAVPPATNDLRLRMMAEDLHFAAIVDAEVAPKFPAAIPVNLTPYKPQWSVDHLATSHDTNVIFYPAHESTIHRESNAAETSSQTIERMAKDEKIRIAVANPFAWELPVWIASEQIDGIFVLGDWLREDKRVERIVDGRPASSIDFDGALGPGQYAEQIYWNLLEAGLRIAPLAGTGTKKGSASKTPIGYNRVYVHGQKADFEESKVERLGGATEVLEAVWNGCSVVTNGPMLRPTLGGFPPGHVFKSNAGEVMHLGMALELAVRDEVEYLEIIHNGRSFHRARLDEFAEAGGRLPEMIIKESGWVIVRVVTAHKDHYRLAMSAPWYIEFDSKPRISREAVKFFGKWLVDTENRLRQLPPVELQAYVPAVTEARRFWTQRFADATED